MKFSTRAQIHRSHLGKLEKDLHRPHPDELNQIIGISALDQSSMSAQMIRLLRVKQYPMMLSDLATSPYVKLTTYLMRLMGITKDAFLRKRERLRRETPDVVRNKADEFIQILEIDPKSAMAEIIQLKAMHPKRKAPHEIVQMVFSGERDGQFLFQENLQEIDRNEVKKPFRNKELLNTVRRCAIKADESDKVIGYSLKALREKLDLSQRQVVQNDSTKLDLSEIGEIELGKVSPSDVSVIAALLGMGFSIHSHEVSYFIDLLKETE